MGLANPVGAPAAEDVSAQLAVAAVEEKRWEAEKQAQLDAGGQFQASAGSELTEGVPGCRPGRILLG